MKTRFLVAAGLLSTSVALCGAPLTESTFTEVVKEVNVVPQATKAARPAQMKEIVKAPDLVRTGPASRAELTAPDQTITRVGANTVFSFEAAGRNMNLEKGSVLFHSPAGKGGGTIRSGGASAAVLGTTLIVAATDTGGFKVLMLEGRGRVTLPNGRSVTLNAGQMVYVLPGDAGFSPVLDINLDRLVSGSLLVNGFARPLPSLAAIQEAVAAQNKKIASGQAEDTGTPADQYAKRGQSRSKGMNSIDATSYQTGVAPEISGTQIVEIIQGGSIITGVLQPGGRGIAIVQPE